MTNPRLAELKKAEDGLAQDCVRPWYWLASKGHKPSKTAFWLFTTMVCTTSLLVVIIVRLALIPDELFTEALVGGAAFFGLITWLVGRLYHNGKGGAE